MAQIYESRRAGVKLYLKSENKKADKSTFTGEEGIGNPVNGFGDCRTTAVIISMKLYHETTDESYYSIDTIT